MKDAAVTGAVVGAFALLITIHFVIFFRLAKRHRFVESIGGFVAAPLAPLFAFRAGMTALAATWVVTAVTYVGALIAASH